MAGREQGELLLRVCHHASPAELAPAVEASVSPGATINTDEWRSYDHPEELAPPTPQGTTGGASMRATTNGDGVREVHVNTIEGETGRGFQFSADLPRREQGVYLAHYVAVYEWTLNAKRIRMATLRCSFTSQPTQPVTRLATTKITT